MASHDEELRDPLDGRYVNAPAAADDDDHDDGLGSVIMGPPSTPLRSAATFHTAYTPATPGTAASALSTPTTAGMDSRARPLFLGGGGASNGSSPGASPSRAERRRRRKMAAYHRWEAKYGFRIIAYVNTKSGGKQGQQVLEKLRTRLPPHQVHDLFQPFEGVEHTLPKHMADADNERFERGVERVKTLRILACGGDGTVGWVASSMEKLDLEYMPEVALLPLGTGNDLAKVLRWQRYFNKIETFHVKHFIKKVFTARSSRLDRWKLRVLTADVLDRDQLHMFVPPSLRRTHSLVGGSEAHHQLDHELMKVQLAKRQSLYRRNLAAAQRVAAQWFEDRELFEKQQQVSGGVTDFRKWQEAHHASKQNASGAASAEDVEVEVEDALSAKNRALRAAAADPRDLVRCNIGGLPVAIDHREKKLFTAEEILAKARQDVVGSDQVDPKRLRKIADASLAEGKEEDSSDEEEAREEAANPANGGTAKVGTGKYRRRKKRSPRPVASAATALTSEPVDKAKPVTYNRAESVSSMLSSAASSPQKGEMSPGSRARARAPSSSSDSMPPRLPKVTEGSAPETSTVGGDDDQKMEHSEQPRDDGHDSFSSDEDGPTSGAASTSDATDNNADVETTGTLPFPERVATPTRVTLDAAIEKGGQRRSARVRFAPSTADEAKTSERLERRILGSPTNAGDSAVSPSDSLVFTRTLTPAPRVSFSFGKERAHFSGAGIVFAGDGVDGTDPAITDDEEYDPAYHLRREREEAAQLSEHDEEEEQQEKEAATPPSFGSSSKDRGASGGGAAKPPSGRPKQLPTRRQTLEMQASHFRPWKTGTLLNYFHVGVGARLVYEFEAERRNAPQHFTSRKANNCMYMSKWLRACCLTCKESLECNRESRSRPPSTHAREGGRRHDIMEQSEFGFVEPVNSKITLKIRPPPPHGSPVGTVMPYEELNWQGRELAEIAFVNIGSFGGGRIRTDQGFYNRSFSRNGTAVQLGDGVIEIIGFHSLTHICCAMGCNDKAVVLGQATEILMYVHRNDELYMGVDGEPFKASGVDEQGIDFAIHLAPDMQIPMLRPR